MVLRRRKIRTVSALAVLAVAGLIALVLPRPITIFLAAPFIRLWQLVDSLPQRLVWSTLALVGFLGAYFLCRGPRKIKPEIVAQPKRSPSQTRIEYLAQLIQLAESSFWTRKTLGQRLTKIAAGFLALRKGRSWDEVQEEIEAGRWPADPRLFEVLQPKMEGEDKDYAFKLAYALDVLERYAKGESLESDRRERLGRRDSEPG